MASFVMTDVSVTINSVDLSDHILEVRITEEQEHVEDSAMGSRWRTFIANAGPAQFTGELVFKQDFAANEVDATLDAIWTGSALVTLVVLPTSASVGATNPSFTGSVQLGEVPRLDGAWGERSDVSVPFQGSGQLTRATA